MKTILYDFDQFSITWWFLFFRQSSKTSTNLKKIIAAISQNGYDAWLPNWSKSYSIWRTDRVTGYSGEARRATSPLSRSRLCGTMAVETLQWFAVSVLDIYNSRRVSKQEQNTENWPSYRIFQIPHEGHIPLSQKLDGQDTGRGYVAAVYGINTRHIYESEAVKAKTIYEELTKLQDILGRVGVPYPPCLEVNYTK